MVLIIFVAQNELTQGHENFLRCIEFQKVLYSPRESCINMCTTHPHFPNLICSP